MEMIFTPHFPPNLRLTDGRTDGRTDDGEFNSPPSSFREAGDNKHPSKKGAICSNSTQEALFR